MQILAELKRRNVFRVGIAYAVVAWVVLQVLDVVGEILELPAWGGKLILAIIVAGFFVTLFVAWAFELTPEGVKRESEVDRSRSITAQTGRKLDRLIIGFLVIAVVVLLGDRFLRAPEIPDASRNSAQTAEQQSSENPALDEKSIAVLPFANRSNREEDEFFTEGIHDDLLTHLSKIGSMKVISRTSVLRYKDTEKPIPEIAAELNVSSVLEGGIQRSGDKVRINVQLIDARTDKHLWAEIFDRELTAENLFAIQSEISTRIAEALEATLSPAEESRLQNLPTTNMAAYNAYLRGRHLQARRTSEDSLRALAEFTRATELDPGYALAWVGVADSSHFSVTYGTLPVAEARAIQRRAVSKALEIDDELGEALVSQAALLEGEEDFEAAESAYRRAIELSPNYARAWQWYGELLSQWPDRLDESLALLQKAAELDPMSPVIQSSLADKFRRLGRFDEALALRMRLTDLDPDFALNYSGLAWFHFGELGQFAQGLEWQKTARRKDPGNMNFLEDEALMYLNLGDYAAVENLREDMQDLDPEHWRIGIVDFLVNVSRANYPGARESAQWILSRQDEPWVKRVIGFSFALEKKYAEAREMILASNPAWGDPDQWAGFIQSRYDDACQVAGIFAGAGDSLLARQLIDETLEYYARIESIIDRSYTVAPINCWVVSGDHELALGMLETQVRNNDIAFWWIRYRWPWWDDLRSEPRFQAAMETIALKVDEQRRLIDELQTIN